MLFDSAHETLNKQEKMILVHFRILFSYLRTSKYIMNETAKDL